MIRDIVATILFVSEVFNAWAHFAVLFRIRLLPRADMSAKRYYFLMEMAIMLATLLFTENLSLLVVINIVLHSYYVTFWETTHFAKKIVTWSSLDWLQSKLAKHWEWDSVLIVLFDLSVHIWNVFSLWEFLSNIQLLIAFNFAVVLIVVYFYGSTSSWSSPNNIQPLVQKRIIVNTL